MSSLFAALGVVVSGLGAQSQAISNISSDLANTETTAYKGVGTAFSNLVTASGTSNSSSGGVTAAPRYQNDVQGTITTTSTVTDLAISGSGYFIVSGSTETASGTTEFTGTYYTRQGDFTLDKNGYMVNSSGYFLEGYNINSNGIVDTSSTAEVQISSLVDDPVPTTTVKYSANLPASASTSYSSTTSTVDVYDSLGQTHQMNVSWVNQGNNKWNAIVSVANGLGTASNYTATIPVNFNTDGTISSVSSGAGYTVDSGTTAGASINLTFPGAAGQTIDINLGTLNKAAGVTQFAGSSSTVSVSSISQNGLGEGSYSSITIDKDGIIAVNYTNGSAKKLYQVPIANFNNSNGLQNGSGGVYSATLTSGNANLHLAGTFGSGKVASSSLESSNVDIATEFTTMIQDQQAYSANAKVVTTVNSMLNTIIQAVQ